MRIALLTPDGPPAVQYAKTIAEAYDLCGIVVRSTPSALSFETAHKLDRQQIEIEVQTWFGGSMPALADIAAVTQVPDVIGEEALAAVRALKPDVIVAAGVGAISQDLIDFTGSKAVVLHAGNPQDYRGDDTYLWAVYHQEIDRLESVVQYAHSDVNAGSVLFSTPPQMTRDMPLAGLRMAVADGCAAGTLKVLRFFDGGGMLTVNRLQRLGKVYTAMPAVVKDICIEQFARWADSAE